MNTNVAKQVEKLINQVWIVSPRASVFVSSLVPKPTRETLMEPVVRKANYGINAMCKRLHKYRDNVVKYIPIHQLFLEKWKHTDEKSGQMLCTTRITQPHGENFIIGTDTLNLQGVKKVLKEIERNVRIVEDTGKCIEDRKSLKIEISNEKWQPDGSSSGSHEHSSDKSKIPEGKGQAMKRKRSCLGEKENRVGKLVKKWEELSQTSTGMDSIDLELGGESVVQVDLGDTPQKDRSLATDSRENEGMMKESGL